MATTASSTCCAFSVTKSALSPTASLTVVDQQVIEPAANTGKP